MTKLTEMINLKAAVSGATFLTALSCLLPTSAQAGAFGFSNNPADPTRAFTLNSEVENTSVDPNEGIYPNTIGYYNNPAEISGEFFTAKDFRNNSPDQFVNLTVIECCSPFENGDIDDDLDFNIIQNNNPTSTQVEGLLEDSGFTSITGDIYQYYFTNPTNSRIFSFYLPTEFVYQDINGNSFDLQANDFISRGLDPDDFLPTKTLLGIDILAAEAQAGGIDPFDLFTSYDFQTDNAVSGSGNRFIVINRVPEPTTGISLLALGLFGGIQLLKRKKIST